MTKQNKIGWWLLIIGTAACAIFPICGIYGWPGPAAGLPFWAVGDYMYNKGYNRETGKYEEVE